MNKIVITLILSLITFSVSGQIQYSTSITKTIVPLHKSSSFGVALGISASTNGLGGGVIASWNDKLALRLSYEKIDLSFDKAFKYTIDGRSFDVSPTMKAGGISAIVDYYVLRSIYVSAGVVSTAFNPAATIFSADPLKIGDITYTPDEMGELRLAIKPENKVAPYAALGFGRNISRDHRFGISFEMGAYFMGSYVVDLSGTNFFESNNANTSLDNLNKTLGETSWSGIYPVLKLGVSYKIWKN